MKHCYVILLGQLGSDAYFYSVYDRKATAVKDMRSSGYIYDKNQDAYINHKSGQYCTIERVTKNTL